MGTTGAGGFGDGEVVRGQVRNQGLEFRIGLRGEHRVEPFVVLDAAEPALNVRVLQDRRVAITIRVGGPHIVHGTEPTRRATHKSSAGQRRAQSTSAIS